MNIIRTNYIKAKIDNTQQNSKCGLFRNEHETNNKISERSKLMEKEYKSTYDWVEKVIQCELCNKVKFDHITISYMLNPEPS